MILATPLTICVVVLGRHVERLAFLDVMFGDRPALSPPEIFYQRMLAEDPAEAVDKAEEFLKEKPLSAYYDEVALKGLKLAQNDLEMWRERAGVYEVLMDDIALKVYDAFAYHVTQANFNHRVKTVSLWSLQMTASAVLAALRQSGAKRLCRNAMRPTRSQTSAGRETRSRALP